VALNAFVFCYCVFLDRMELQFQRRCAPFLADAESKADLILSGGKIWTENPSQPEAEAVAIRANRIMAVGTSKAILKLAGSHTKVIDLRGRRVLPGFNDAHLHFYMGGASLSLVQLRNAGSPSAFRDEIGKFARTRPKGEWILGGNWDHQNWAPPVLPNHELIDPVTLENPVFVNRFEGHSSLANSLAMKLAGIDRDTKDVPGGEIVRDAHRDPTGIFKDAARSLVERCIPVASEAQAISAILAAQQHAAQYGVTSVQEMGVLGLRRADTLEAVIRAYQNLQDQHQLHVRVSVHFPLPEYRRFAQVSTPATDMLQMNGIKSFADGALGSSTAWFFDPYTDAPLSCGIPSDELNDPDEMYRNLCDADCSGLQLAVHAIGDRANHTILNFFERLQQDNGPRDRRLRIEHAQHLQPADIARFARLNVIASVQPYHCIDDGRWADRRIGPERAKTTYAFRSLLDAGAILAFGSDWFVAPIDPLQGIYAAVTRRPLDEKCPDGWVPEQKISVAEAVHAYTLGGAYASRTEKIKGSLEPGKLADIAVLSQDIFHIRPEQIRETKVDLTVFDGQVIYERK
jgi:predicted amidohydrolase YtcJ